ncbi:uncharacterized protein LOC105170136 [Sesamum indicum]|uniref:Uncharacterized protein LOC105170136 n=1 Tax=Sesamum indicum TaxID=4182 RepID=A0A6I9TRK0_SESIN|nr:uncharacterized protein LOC105170136 [Sesamum indicum]
MSELCCTPKSHFSTLIISDLALLCSFILSHPLYFSYFIFFSPYILKLISFLSPLLATTFLLSLAFLTVLVHDNFSTALERSLGSKKDCENEEFQCFEDLGMYQVLFGSSMDVVEESPLEEKSMGDSVVEGSEGGDKVEINTCDVAREEKRLENFLKILDEFERMASNVEERKKVEPSKSTKIDKFVEKRNGSEAICGSKINFDATKVDGSDSISGGKEHITPMVKAHSQRVTSPKFDRAADEENDSENKLKTESSRTLDHCSLGSYGSMRKEKEWKRTLACKLFEERHNVDGGDGMDSLWEAYELDSKNKAMNNVNRKKNKNKNKNKKEEIVEMYTEEEEEEVDGQLCCLQALKLSAGKMNLGMGRPNLVKITKAIKGIGWLHHVTKHSKKVHNNGDRY